jgi:hypothetical protein
MHALGKDLKGWMDRMKHVTALGHLFVFARVCAGTAAGRGIIHMTTALQLIPSVKADRQKAVLKA